MEEQEKNDQNTEKSLEDRMSVLGPTDITLIAGGEQIPCHKAKLAESSSYFQAMFRTDMIESKASTVELKAVHAHLLRILVQYCYSHELDLTVDTVGDILSTASMFQFLPVIQACTQYLLPNVHIDNCLTVMYLADTCALTQLYCIAKKYALWYFKEVVQRAGFLNLSVDSLRDYLSNDMLNVTGEMSLVDAIVRWTSFDRATRAGHFASLLSQLRLRSLSRDELVGLGQLELVRSIPECIALVEKMVELSDANTNEVNGKVT